MFWKFVEFIVRIVYFRRFRAAEQIGQAGKLLADGRPEEALQLLERAGTRLHQSLLPLYALIRGRILDTLGRLDDAEEAFKLVVLTDPKSAKADLELAVLAGRRCRFDECRMWLDRLEAKDDPETKREAVGIRDLLNQITSGEREMEFAQRARAMAETALAESGVAAGLPPDLTVLGDWFGRKPQTARRQLDEVALLLGQGEVERGAHWRISLSIEESVVIRDDGSQLNPFQVVDTALGSSDQDIAAIIERSWQSPPSVAPGSIPNEQK